MNFRVIPNCFFAHFPLFLQLPRLSCQLERVMARLSLCAITLQSHALAAGRSRVRAATLRCAAAPSSWEVFYRDNNTCQYCGKAGDTIDHVIPKSQGGKRTWTNLVCCCQSCNTTKGANTPKQAGTKLRRSPKES